MKKAIISANLLLMSLIGSAQSTETKPSVNAQQFISGASCEVGLRTGQVSVNIPLFSLPGKGVDIPISLVFNNEGVTHESESSSIGLGWSLMAGGVITATIRDKDDWTVEKLDDIPWQSSSEYLRMRQDEERQNPYTSNKFASILDAICWQSRITDAEPDTYKYAFGGYSGDICFRFNNQNLKTGVLHPDVAFKIEKTTDGFKITADDGIVYFFENKEVWVLSTDSRITSWFLSKIKTIQGGQVDFYYEDEKIPDLTYYLDFTNGIFPKHNTKRLIKIITDYGRVEFKSASRGDIKEAKKITNIELYNNNGLLVKGYKLGNNSYFVNENEKDSRDESYSLRQRLDRIEEYNHKGEYLPPYIFEYDYYFTRSKTSYRYSQFEPLPVNSWATNPSYLAFVDRGIDGYPACYTIYPGTEREYIVGYQTSTDSYDHTYNDYFCLKKITFPAGGNESYTYGPHDYTYISGSKKVANIPSDFKVMGKRLIKKVITDNKSTTQIVEYKYCLHDEEYRSINESSGVLIEPSIHTSTKFEPQTNDNYTSILKASPIITSKPQNSLSTPPVCYKEVEEIFKSESTGEILGKKIYYFESATAVPPEGYCYVSYMNKYTKFPNPSEPTPPDLNTYQKVTQKVNILTPLYNTLYGTLAGYSGSLSGLNDQNMCYMAYPVGHFSIYDPTRGKVLKEVTLNNQGRVVKKIENSYEVFSISRCYGLKIMNFKILTEKIKGQYLEEFEGHNISVNCYVVESCRLGKSITTIYFPDQNTSITEEQTFNYTNGNRIKSSSVRISGGGDFESIRYYPPDYADNTSKGMADMNMTGIPIEEIKMKGQNVIAGEKTTYQYDQKSGTYLPYILYKLGAKNNLNLQNYRDYYYPKTYFDKYNSKGKNVETRTDEESTVYLWGYKNQYVIAEIKNATFIQISNIISESKQEEIANRNEPTRDDWNLILGLQCLPNSLVTILKYKDMVGLTEIIDPSGRTIYHEYDSFGRITEVYLMENNTKKILQYYEYNYQNPQTN